MELLRSYTASRTIVGMRSPLPVLHVLYAVFAAVVLVAWPLLAQEPGAATAASGLPPPDTLQGILLRQGALGVVVIGEAWFIWRLYNDLKAKSAENLQMAVESAKIMARVVDALDRGVQSPPR